MLAVRKLTDSEERGLWADNVRISHSVLDLKKGWGWSPRSACHLCVQAGSLWPSALEHSVLSWPNHHPLPLAHSSNFPTGLLPLIIHCSHWTFKKYHSPKKLPLAFCYKWDKTQAPYFSLQGSLWLCPSSVSNLPAARCAATQTCPLSGAFLFAVSSAANTLRFHLPRELYWLLFRISPHCTPLLYTIILFYFLHSFYLYPEVSVSLPRECKLHEDRDPACFVKLWHPL